MLNTDHKNFIAEFLYKKHTGTRSVAI